MVLCVCYAASLFGVSILAILHEDHHCVVVERCAVCVHIRDTQSLLKRLFLILTCCGLLLVSAFRRAGEQGAVALGMAIGTPVAFKVRMNN